MMDVSGPTGRSKHSFMKKAIVVLLLCAVAVSGIFADEPENPKHAKLFNSISFGGGFDMYTATVTAYKAPEESFEVKSDAMGPGAGIAAMIDLSAIPDFLKEGWFVYCDVDVFFPARVTIEDKVYDKESGDTRIGVRTHMDVLKRADFGIPIKFYFGAGLSYGIIYAWKITDTGTVSDASSQAFGAGLLSIAEYAFSDHFAVTVSVAPDITFLSRVANAVRYKGTDIIMRYSSVGFGFSLSARAGVRYIF